jgi:hypothetical protein
MTLVYLVIALAIWLAINLAFALTLWTLSRRAQPRSQ